MPTRTKNRTFVLLCIFFIAFASLQCRKGDNQVQSNSSAISILWTWGDERFLGPSWDADPQYLVFLPLFEENEKGELEGKLVKSWEHSPDYRIWTYHLRKDVRWHDGVPVTAHDIKFTCELLSNPEILYFLPDQFESIKIIDDFTLRITYSKKENPLNTKTVYYPKHLLQDQDPKKFYGWKFWTHPVGNGPYRYVRHVPKSMIELEANPDYYRGKPRIERVMIKFGGIPLTELLSGNVDVLAYSANSRLDSVKLANDPRFRVYHFFGITSSAAIYWNHNHSFFQDPFVRRALTLAINRTNLLHILDLPDDIPIIDVLLTKNQILRGDIPEPLPYDPELARQLLAKAGWLDEDGDGVRERDGQKFHFTAIAAEGDLSTAAVYVQDQLRQVGVRMEIQTLAMSVISDRRVSREYEALIQIFSLYALEKKRISGYSNPELIKLLDDAKDDWAPDWRERLCRKLMPIFQEDVPLTILYPQVFFTIAHRRLHGLSSPFNAIPERIMEHLWIEEEN